MRLMQRVLNDLKRTRLSHRRGFLPRPFSISKLDRGHTGLLRKIDNLLTREGRREWGGAKSYDSEKALSSINH
jgi:hypothetical protein